MSYIFFNNLSSNTLDLKIENIPTIPSTIIEYETIIVDGGENLTKIKGFKDIEISFNFVYKANEEEFFMKKAVIDNWLLSSKSKYLNYSMDNQNTYYVKEIKISETKTTTKIVRRFTVTFTCNGLKYITKGLLTRDVTLNGSFLDNLGTYESKPILKIHGSGTITVNVNNISFSIKDVIDYVTIDTTIKECYKDNINLGKNMAGDWPVFSIGKNIISWIGTVSKIEIVPRWRCY